MGMDIQVKPEQVFENEDRRWLGTRKGTLDMRSVTLGSAHFSAAHTAAKGAVPSGTALAKYPDGLYGPYDPAGEDGEEEFAGLLFSTTQIDRENEAPIGVALFWTGVVKVDFLPEFEGTDVGEVDAAARTATENWIRWEDDTNSVVA